MVEGDTVTRHIALDPGVLRRMPAARHLLESPEYRNLISYAGSSSATPMVYLQTILSGAVAGPPDPQTDLHTDTFHPTVKAWLFLTDVAADAMPFVYVPGSHRLTPQRLDWERRMSDRGQRRAGRTDPHRLVRAIAPETLAELGLPPPRAIAVPANTLVVADTFGFHARGPSARPTTRVEIWAMGRRNPFLPWAGLDPWSIAGARAAQAALLLEIGRSARPLRARPPALARPRPGFGLRPGVAMDGYGSYAEFDIERSATAPQPRSFLFLQGPISTFFDRLGRALIARGHRVHRINLHFGDQLFWRLPATNFRGRFDDWRGFHRGACSIGIRSPISSCTATGGPITSSRPRRRGRAASPCSRPISVMCGRIGSRSNTTG